MKSVCGICSKSILKLPKNFYNFSIRFINNPLVNSTNMCKCGKTSSLLCLHRKKREILGNVVDSCEKSLKKKIDITFAMIQYYYYGSWRKGKPGTDSTFRKKG